MEDIKNKMPMHKRIFFTNLEKYLDAPLYYFGSIQRYDYSPENSDIDAMLFTNNESSSISQLQNWFQVSRNDFKKVVHFLPSLKRIVYGHKLKYKTLTTSADILIYNKKDQQIIPRDDQRKINMPFYMVTIMIMLKTLYHQFGILSKPWYKYLKRLLMDVVDDGVYFLKIKSSTWKFLIFDIPYDKPEEDS